MSLVCLNRFTKSSRPDQKTKAKWSQVGIENLVPESDRVGEIFSNDFNINTAKKQNAIFKYQQFLYLGIVHFRVNTLPKRPNTV